MDDITSENWHTLGLRLVIRYNASLGNKLVYFYVVRRPDRQCATSMHKCLYFHFHFHSFPVLYIGNDVFVLFQVCKLIVVVPVGLFLEISAPK